MARDYARKQGFKGYFYVEPKPAEPSKHQYDFDAATCIGFLRHYGLQDDFRLNLETNHATLAGHSFQHELRVAVDAGMFARHRCQPRRLSKRLGYRPIPNGFV